MKMYRTKHRYYNIEELEVTKVTDKQVTYVEEYKAWPTNEIKTREGREAKVSTWQIWHNTYEDAYNYLFNGINSEIASHERQIEGLIESRSKLVNSKKE